MRSRSEFLGETRSPGLPCTHPLLTLDQVILSGFWGCPFCRARNDMVRAIPRGKRSYLPDYIAFLAMLTVAASVATGLVLQFGMTLPMAGAVALSALAAAMTGHILMRRNDSIALLEAELADREARHRSGGLPPGAMGAGGEADDAPVPPLGDYRPAMTAPDLTAPDLTAPDLTAPDLAASDMNSSPLYSQPVRSCYAALGDVWGCARVLGDARTCAGLSYSA